LVEAIAGAAVVVTVVVCDVGAGVV